MKSVTVLGATGSIGRQTLEVIARHPDRFCVAGLAAGSNADELIALAKRTDVKTVAIADEQAAQQVRAALGPDVAVLDGAQGVNELAGMSVDVVVNGIEGSRGLGPTLAALAAGSRLALANKESLVLGGPLVRAAMQYPEQLVPVDSEHSALLQCLRGGNTSEVARVVLTASGGPFRGRSRAELQQVTAEQALDHPTWQMGPLVTINSATLANKGLEVIEAHVLFDIDYDHIDVVVHPQSVVHAMVEFSDGATIAKLSPPDMRLPIQLALAWPERLDYAPTRMDWTAAQQLDFEPVDHDTFPMVGLAIAAGRAGGSAPGVFNAANEEAVAAFLAGKLGFLHIAAVVEQVLATQPSQAASSVEAVLEAETQARVNARRLIEESA